MSPGRSRFIRRLIALFRWDARDQDMDQEMAFHVESMTREYVRAGMSEAEANRAVRQRFGSVLRLKEHGHDIRTVRTIEDLARDVTHAARALKRSPGFTAAVVLTLALGIGANTAIFSLLNAVVLRQLPVRNPEQLVELLSRYPGEPGAPGFSREIYEHYLAQNHVFSDLMATRTGSIQVSTPGRGAEPVNGEYVTGNFFSSLGLQPSAGRLITVDDDRRAADAPAAVVSWPYWQRELGGDPAVVGQSIVANNVPVIVVGVAPREFVGLQIGQTTDLWMPSSMAPKPGERFSDQFALLLMGRLKTGISLDQAAAEMRVLDRPRVNELARRSGDLRWHQATLDLVPAGAGFSRVRNALATPLLILMLLVGLLLALACTNVASMLLARSAARQKEMAVRVSLGAGRMRLVRQVLTESMLLAAMGALFGVGIAYFGVRALVLLVASARPMIGATGPIELAVTPDTRVLLFTAGLTALTGLLFGLAPACVAFGSTPASALRETARGGQHRSRRLFGQALVVTQVALSVVLLSAAGLFARHLSSLRSLDLGFEPESVLLFTLDASDSGHSREQRALLYQPLLERLRALPGVRVATLSGVTPIEGGGAASFVNVEGFEEAPAARRMASINSVAPGYFETLGTPLVSGRDFSFEDAGRPGVAIVNRAWARHYFAGANPIGRRFALQGQHMSYEIVGVVGDAKYRDLHQPPPQTIYFNAFQDNRGWSSHFALRTTGPPMTLAGQVRRAVDDVVTNTRVARITTLTEQMDASIVPERLTALLSTMFGVLAVLLTAIGLYGLLSYSFARRMSEMGVRMALGATQRDVVMLVLRSTAALVGAGLALGVPLAIWSNRLAANTIGNLPASGVPPIVIAAATILGVAALAAYGPARNVAHIEPLVALRQE